MTWWILLLLYYGIGVCMGVCFSGREYNWIDAIFGLVWPAFVIRAWMIRRRDHEEL